MNLLAFGLILICCHAWAIETDDNFVEPFAQKRTKLEEALEKLRTLLRNGGEGFPVLDPFIKDRLPLKLNESIPAGNIEFDGLFTKINVTGISNYTINSADFKIFGLKLHANLTWPTITANLNYTMNGKVLDFGIYGTGGMDAALHDLNIQVDMSCNLKNSHVQVKQMSTKISLRALNFHATGLYNDEGISDILSKTISEVMPKLIKENQKVIVDNINQVATEMLNDYLNTITLKELLKLLGL
ncbi:PREDICTED: uncharacterized protein LOC105456760 [Wasmannia auropunctata]|uniref:uncharacterized protein LOC105456760 n=1 Tax=Wasmannia auropunctata TaxID=64793 RepID=UPI0005F09D9C|nr:PREDICTED: uncharacterized protein LOC105456760 [Wasmannia auropunctata]